MNKKNLIKIVLLIFTISAFCSCEKWIDPDININPDRVSEVTMKTLLPSIEAHLAYVVSGGSDIIGYQAIWLQQLDGTAGESMTHSNYVLQPTSVGWLFDGTYSNAMMDALALIDLATEKNSPHNKGVAKICLAICLGQLTDVFNDIPWSEAFQGIANPTPAYDSQEFTYSEIQRLLTEAIHNLSEPNEPIGIDGDYFYDGDHTLWLKAAHALKARYYLHLTKRNGNQAYQNALGELNLAFTSNMDDLQFKYGPGANESNPLHQFMRDWDNVRMGAYFIDMLKEYDDPRLGVYAYPNYNDEYTGSIPGSGNSTASKPGSAVADAESPTYVITFVEILFMKAEIMYQTGNNENQVKEVLIQAVSESLDQFDVYNEDWLTEYTSSIENLQGNDLFEELMTQKYIATFYQPEVYHSWRRTGFPVIPPNPVGAEAEIPRRFPYSSFELVFNKENVPQGITITDRVWWDE
nr:SusD/RagB family nutrient-binding outer membrane lipoprotein [Bacteroidota bacterium]